MSSLLLLLPPFSNCYPLLLSITIASLFQLPITIVTISTICTPISISLNQLQWKMLEGFMMISASIHKSVHLILLIFVYFFHFVSFFTFFTLFTFSHQKCSLLFPIISSLSAAGRKFPTHKCSTRYHLPQPHQVRCTVLCFAVYSAIIGL